MQGGIIVQTEDGIPAISKWGSVEWVYKPGPVRHDQSRGPRRRNHRGECAGRD
jgi:hypothetical protein